MERKNKIPLTRLSRYYDDVDFEMEMEMASDVIEEDANFTVVLFRIDRVKSNVDVYGESNSREIRYLAPIELKVIFKLEASENKNYAPNGSVRYQEYGNLTFYVLTSHLKKKNVDISYGDIIGYSDREDNLKYFEVFDDGKINSDNEHLHFGFRPYYRTIKCVVLDPNVFNGI